jgi:response regulator NasT
MPPLRIAVADDEPDMRDYFVRMLPRWGHEVVSVAETGLELVQHCREFKPDLVITDVRMPGMDGIAAALALCSDRPIPVILVSAHHDDASSPANQGQWLLLRKPFVYSDLESAIEAAMRDFRGGPSQNHEPQA